MPFGQQNLLGIGALTLLCRDGGVYMHVRRYAPRSYSQRVNHQQVSILLRIRLPDTEYLLRISCAHERIDYQAVFSNGLRTGIYLSYGRVQHYAVIS